MYGNYAGACVSIVYNMCVFENVFKYLELLQVS